MVKKILFAIFVLSAAPARAALTSSNVPVHTHASVQQGGTVSGATLSNTTLSGTTTNSGTLSGGTVAPTTLTVPSGTTLSGATLSGATLVDSTVLSSSWLKPSSDTDVVRVRAFSPTQSASIFVVQNSAGSSTYFSIAAAGAATVTNALAVGSLSTGGAVSAGSFSTSGTVSSTKACASGFVRESPNFCRAISSSGITWSTTTTCTAQSTGSVLPTDAKAVLLTVQARALAANAVGFRNFFVNFFNEAACTNVNVRASVVAREQVADPGLNELIRTSTQHTVKLTASNTFHTTQGAATAGNVYAANVDGYFD